eukprot:TRINITY_DN23752_c0_g1_i1.p1 TRINITY_DN23752_c0_g1~~TRINITY_DN23752_c0_g1_i1.p1  ORF type:complete len:595 (+),score=94.76 TRINITY_DN23752_c0_g1_i1:25-1809(+)
MLLRPRSIALQTGLRHLRGSDCAVEEMGRASAFVLFFFAFATVADAIGDEFNPDFCIGCHGCLWNGKCRHIDQFPQASPERCQAKGGRWCTDKVEAPPVVEEQVAEKKEADGQDAKIIHSEVDLPPYEPADGGEHLDEGRCADLATSWAARQMELAQARRDSEIINTAFFLHVPRTAGRVIHHCVLRPTLVDRCMRSYDALRMNFSDPSSMSCGYFASHHDHRLVDLATAHGRPYVALMVRSPLDRVVSSYEFAAEVSARTRSRYKSCKPAKTCTRHVWPWNHLVSYFDETFLEERRLRRHHARLARANTNINPSDAGSGHAMDPEQLSEAASDAAAEREADAIADRLDEARDPYNNSVLVPLAEFLNLEMQQDVLNNLLTFQLLGLTELTPVISHEDGSGPAVVAQAAKEGDLSEDSLPLTASARLAAQLRRCTRDHGPEALVSKILLEVALEHLSDVDLLMVHERMDESIATARALNNERPKATEWKGDDLTRCVEQHTKKMLKRKDKGSYNMRWPDGTQIAHGKTSRATLSDDMVAFIQRQNWMDVALYEHAVGIFDKYLRAMETSPSFATMRVESVVRNMELKPNEKPEL